MSNKTTIPRLYSLEELEPMTNNPNLTAASWRYFRRHPTDESKVVCEKCWGNRGPLLPEEIPSRQRSTSTHANTTHLRKKHNVEIPTATPPPPQQPQINMFLRCSDAQKKANDEALLDWMTTTHQPYSMVDREEFKTFVNTLCPGYRAAARDTLKLRLGAKVCMHREILKKYLSESLVAGSLSADGWSREGTSLFGVILHFIDKRGHSLELLLGAVPKEGSQNAKALAKAVEDILESWGLLEEIKKPENERKIDMFTTDTTAVMPKMVEELGLKWVPCFAHVLNLIVQDGLRVTERVMRCLKKCRKMCTAISKSNLTRDNIVNARNVHNIHGPMPKGDVKTRWNSTERMVSTIFENKFALLTQFPTLQERRPRNDETKTEKKDRKRRLTQYEWRLVEDLVKILKVFVVSTDSLQYEKKPTISLILPLMKHLQKSLDVLTPDSMGSEDGVRVVRALKESFQTRFHRAIEKSRNNILISTFFDPRTKNLASRNTISVCRQLFAALAPETIEQHTTRQVQRREAHPLEIILGGFEEEEEEVEDEFERYLQAKKLSPRGSPREFFDNHNFPTIMLLYRRYCCTPGAATSIERVWSEAGHLKTKRRNRLGGDVINERLQYKKNKGVIKHLGL